MRTLRDLAQALAALALTRAEFASVELSLAREHFLRWLLLALAAAVLSLVALVAASAALVALLWERWGWLAPAALALLYGAGAAFLVRKVAREAQEAPPLLEQTFAELALDRAALFGTPGERAQGAEAENERA